MANVYVQIRKWRENGWMKYGNRMRFDESLHLKDLIVVDIDMKILLITWNKMK